MTKDDDLIFCAHCHTNMGRFTGLDLILPCPSCHGDNALGLAVVIERTERYLLRLRARQRAKLGMGAGYNRQERARGHVGEMSAGNEAKSP